MDPPNPECAGTNKETPIKLRRWVVHLVPDVALAMSVVTCFYCVFLFGASSKLFRDSDTGWHIRTGERILSTGALPRTDPYSFSNPGRPWYAWEWGADVLMGAAHKLDGLRGVAVLYLLAITACTWLWFRLTWLAGGNFLLACALAVPMLSTVNLHWLARPHVLGWLFLLICLLAIEGRALRSRALKLLFFALTGAAWANVHASFFLLPLVLGIYALGEWCRRSLWQEEGGRDLSELLACALAAAAGSLINPYGWHLHLHLSRYLTDTELLQRVGEFQSFNFHSPGSSQILLALAICITGGVAALYNRRMDHFLLSAFFAAMALRSARGLPLMALTLLPLANGAITGVARQAAGLRPDLRRRLDKVLAYSSSLLRIDARLRGYVPSLLLLLGLLAVLPADRYAFPEDEFPVRATAALTSLPEDARLLAPDKFGGYLIYRFDGRRKVFFDGRSDYYGLEFMKDYIRLVEVRPGWQDEVNRYGFTHALIPNRYSLLPALESLGWRTRYRDEQVSLLSRN